MTSAGRRIAVASLGTALAAGFAAPAVATAQGHKPPHSIGPNRVAWFDITRATAAAPGLPQPGVGPHDLVVDGITVATGQLPLPIPTQVPASTQRVAALAALAFRLPKGATPGTLSLDLTGTTTAKLDSKLPGGVSPVACPTTSHFKSGAQQVGAKAPAYDCKKRSAVGQLSANGQAVEFPGIGRLARGQTLSFVVLPGTVGLERLVFARPGPKTLHLLTFSQPTSPPTLPPTAPPTKGTTSAGGGEPIGGNTGSGTGFSGGGTTELPPINQGTTSNGGGATAPLVAGSGSPQPVLSSAAKPLDDTRARLAAIALLVGLVVATAWLTVTDGTGRAISTLKIVRAVQAGGPLPVLPAKEWGVGRFSSPRNGPPPTI